MATAAPPATAPSRECSSYEGTNGDYPVRRCQQGVTVYYIQLLLQGWGFTVDVDGYFGPGTEDAVMAFQAANGLAVDGLVGPQTWVALSGEASVALGLTDYDGNGRVDPWEFVWD